MSGRVIKLHPRETRLKRRIREHLRRLGFLREADGSLRPPSLDKESYRRIHSVQREEKLAKMCAWLSQSAPLQQHFASGSDIVPSEIEPHLEVVAGDTWQADLFRYAALHWRIPVSDGYGRRMRFLVWDKANQKLIGLIALGDAVFNQKARDEHIGWDHHRRGNALVNLMDAYVLGAIPPYSMLLGGKLIASLIKTRDIVETFEAKYRNSVGVISGEGKRARLAAITTSSALGRSSVYNRLSLGGEKILCPIGYTSGWGHFHFSGAIFDEMRDYLIEIGDDYAHGFDFGSGPNWKIRLIRRALERLGMDTGLAQHGFRREVYFCAVARNAIPFLNGKVKRINYGDLLSVAEMSRLAIERWIMPRASRDPSYLNWSAEEFLASLARDCNPSPPSRVLGA